MRSFRAFGRYAIPIAIASLVLLGCSQSSQSQFGALSSLAPSQRAAVALASGVNATFEQRAAASGVAPACFREGAILNQNGDARVQEQSGFVPPPTCGIAQISEAAGSRVGGVNGAFGGGTFDGNQPAACLPSKAIALARGANSYGELTISFGSLRNPIIIAPTIVDSSLPVGSYSIAVSGGKAVIRVLLSDKLPLEKFAIRTGVTALFADTVECQFVVEAAPIAPQPIVMPPDPVVPQPIAESLPAPESEADDKGEAVAEQGALPEPEGEASGPAPVVVAEEPSATEPEPAPVQEPLVVLPETDPLIVNDPSPGEAPPAPVFQQPEPIVAGDTAPPAPEKAEGEPAAPPAEPLPIVFQQPAPEAVEPLPLPPLVMNPVAEEPSRNPAADPGPAWDDRDADETDQLEASIVRGDDPADEGKLANANLGITCESIRLNADAEGILDFHLSRVLTNGERKKVRGVFRIFDAPGDLFVERASSNHLRSLRLRLRAPSVIGHLRRVAVELQVGGARAACTVSLNPSFIGDDGKVKIVDGSFCGQSSIGAYAATNDDKGGASAEIFFPVPMNGSRDSSRYSIASGTLNIDRDVDVKFSGPLSHRVIVKKRPAKGSARVRIDYVYTDANGRKTDGCDLHIAQADQIATEPPPVFVTAQGLTGNVYALYSDDPKRRSPNRQALPERPGVLYTDQQLAQLNPIAGILMSEINVPARSFSAGFPGAPADLFEWFQIAVGPLGLQGLEAFERSLPRTKLFIPNTGDYQFRTLSDDGVRIYIDGKLVVDDPTVHAPRTRDSSTVRLEAGWHDFALRYFQGPRYQIALVLSWRAVGHANGQWDLGGSWKVIPARAFLTEARQIAVSSN
jgi:hypothetical protein